MARPLTLMGMLSLCLWASPVIGQDCGFYNVTEIADAADDQSAGAPSYVDVRELKVRQIGTSVQFVWDAATSPRNNDQQYFFIVLDTDFDLGTGQRWGGAGGELKIRVYDSAVLTYFNAEGNVIEEVPGMPVIFDANRIVITIDRARIRADRFRLYFESSGGTPHVDRGSTHDIALEPARPEVRLVVEAETLVPTRPGLIHLPVKNAPVQLRAYAVSDGAKTLLPNAEVIYSVTHPVKKAALGDPSAIISVDSSGVARALEEGFVLVSAYSSTCYLTQTRPVVLATGQVYGDPLQDDVIAVFSPDFVPDGSRFSFGDMLSTYPNYIRTVNLAYRIASDLYRGFKPFGGETQIFAPVVMPGLCGGPNNPLETSPCCYMDCGSGRPQYNVVIHEMGHNFADARAMWRLLTANGHRFGRAGLAECVASLPVIYTAVEFNENPGSYGIARTSFEWHYFNDFLRGDVPYARARLEEFERLIREGQISGIFDETVSYDHVATFCSFFQTYAYRTAAASNPHGHRVISRFLSLFGDTTLPLTDAQLETYFAAAYSAAVGGDLRPRLRFWGFTIDDAQFDRFYRTLTARLDGTMFRRRAVRH